MKLGGEQGLHLCNLRRWSLDRFEGGEVIFCDHARIWVSIAQRFAEDHQRRGKY